MGKKKVQAILRNARARCDAKNFDSTKEQVACHLGVLYVESDLVSVGLAGRGNRLSAVLDPSDKSLSILNGAIWCRDNLKSVGKIDACIKGVHAGVKDLYDRHQKKG